MNKLRTRGALRPWWRGKSLDPNMRLRLRWITGHGEVHGDAVGRIRKSVAKMARASRDMVRVFAWCAVGPTRYADPWSAIVVVRGLGTQCHGRSRSEAIASAYAEAVASAEKTSRVLAQRYGGTR